MSDVGFTYCKIRVDEKKCDNCLECVNTCSTGALTYHRACFEHDSSKCSYCEVCMDVCPNGALKVYER